MTSLAVTRSFECAPHATRSVAMALTLSLNLAILLLALRPETPVEYHAPPSQSLLAAVLQPPPPAVPVPQVPVLRVARHAVAPELRVAIAHPLPIAAPELPAITPVAPLRSPTTTSTPAPSAEGASGDSDATIAYETATPPAYPIRALRAGVQGIVLLKVLVDASGKPLQVVIARSSGSRLLDDSARAHVLAAWRFHPAIRDGHAIEAWALVPVRFDLDRD